MTATATEPQAPTLDSVIGELVRVLRTLGREDLVGRATAAGARLHRPSTIVCVVGEFKQGKSSLVNGLLDARSCARSTTTSRPRRSRSCATATTSSAIVRRREDGDQAVSRSDPRRRLGRLGVRGRQPRQREAGRAGRDHRAEPRSSGRVSRRRHAGHGRSRRRPRRGHAGVPPVRRRPDLGVRRVGRADAPEIEFLHEPSSCARPCCSRRRRPTSIPHGERILEINKGHLDAQGIDIPVVAVSNTLRSEALARRDRSLNT